MICRRSAASKAPKVRRSRTKTESNSAGFSDDSQRSTTPSRSASCTRTVPEPARNPSMNAAPVAGGVPPDNACPSRCSTSRVVHAPPSCSSLVARPCTRPCPERVPANCASTSGKARSRARCDRTASAACTPVSRSTITAAPSSSSWRHATPTPARIRTMIPSNTERIDDASVWRTSPYRSALASGTAASINWPTSGSVAARSANSTTHGSIASGRSPNSADSSTPTRSARPLAARPRSIKRLVAADATVVP